MTPRIIVVGANGFLGRALAYGLNAIPVARRDAPNIVRDYDDPALPSLIRSDDSWVVNAAGVPAGRTDDIELIASNLRIARSVARACAHAGASLVHISSADIHPAAYRDGATEDADVLPDTAYGLSKLIAELAIQRIAEDAGMRLVILRPSYVVGKGLPPKRLIPAVARAVRTRTSLELSVAADSVTDYLSLPDLVSAVRIVIDKRAAGIFHVASGTLTSVKDVVAMTMRAAGGEVPVTYGRTVVRQSGPVSTEKLRAVGWLPSTPLADAIAQAVQES